MEDECKFENLLNFSSIVEEVTEVLQKFYELYFMRAYVVVVGDGANILKNDALNS
jgi:hypothetical protein